MTPAPIQQENPIDELIARAGADLQKLIIESRDEIYQQERRIAINRARRNVKFYKGDQFIAPGWVDNGEGEEIADWISIDGEGGNGANQKFLYPVNIFGADANKFVAIMSQSAPNVKSVADDLDDQEMNEATKTAQISIDDLKEKWNAKGAQREIAYHQYITGPAFLHTPYVTDKRKYGTTKVPKLEWNVTPQPDGSMVPLPQDNGFEEYANGDAELHVSSILKVSIPFGKKKLNECEWLRYEYLESKYRLLALYRDKLKQYRNRKDDTGDRDATTATALEAQDSGSVPSSTGRAYRHNQWLYRRIWFQPEVLEGIEDEDLRDVMKGHFPDGLKITMVGEDIVDLENENLCDVWAVVKIGRGEYILENPLCHDSIPFQKATNDLFGLAVETILRAIPKTLVDQALVDIKAMTENDPTPAEVIFTINPNMGDLSKGIKEFPIARLSDQLVPFLLTVLRPLNVDVNGIRPELSGGGQPTSTYREAKQRKDQAMMTLGPPGDEQAAGWEQAYANGTRQRAKYGSGLIKTWKRAGFNATAQGTSGATAQTAEMSQLQEKGWHCEADDQLPVSFTERADRFHSLLTEFPPEIVQSMGLLDIVNIAAAMNLLQLDGFVSPLEEMYRQIIKVIGQLLKEEPIQNQDPMTGQMVMLPSIPIDPVIDDAQFESDVLKKWCNSEEGRTTAQSSQMGFANVRARLEQAQQMVAQAQAAQAAAAAPPPGEGEQPPKGGQKAEKPAEAPPIQGPGPVDAPGVNMQLQ